MHHHLSPLSVSAVPSHDPSEYTPRPYPSLSKIEQDRLAYLDRLKFFLATAPSHWDNNNNVSANSPQQDNPNPHPLLNRFPLPSSEYVTCVLWSGLYHISGTDIVRALTFRFEAFGRPVRNVKKFEEGVFSDLRNLKPGVDACLEEPKSQFLDLLFKYQCIRTQKKQKVFYWFSVPHDRLFLDALERDLKREKAGLEPTTVVTGEPALSFTYDPKRSLYEQFSKAGGTREGEGELEAVVRRADESTTDPSEGDNDDLPEESSDEDPGSGSASDHHHPRHSSSLPPPPLRGPNAPFFSFSIFEGSPTYKQRRKKGAKAGIRKGSAGEEQERGRRFDIDHFVDGHSYDIHLAESTGDIEPLSAAEMFRKQARGELVPSSSAERRRLVSASSSTYPSTLALQQQQQHHHQQQIQLGARPRSFDAMQRHSYPAPSPMSMCLSAPFSTQSFEEAQAQQDQQMYVADTLVGGDFNNASGSTQVNNIQSKAFVCPLFSCGRLFKRMEHLKRHLRTHTMERPYECPTCYKKFSRSDNLNQHVRTHGRAGSAGSASSLGFLGSTGSGGGTDPGMSGEWEWEGGEGSGEGTGSTMETESEDSSFVLPPVTNANATGSDDSLHYASGFPGGLGMEGMADAGLCEVDLHGRVLQDVRGDEEGLLVLSSDHILHQQQQHFAALQDFPTTNTTDQQQQQQLPVQAPQPYVAADGQWVTARAHPSPAFSAMSVPGSPHVGHIPSIRSGHSSLTSSPGSYLRHCSPAATTTGYGAAAGGNETDYATSISAPSHKLAFDHTAMYPPHPHSNMLGLALGVDGSAPSSSSSSGGGTGPIRRHRSMTPSLMRGGPESVRRPAVVVSTGSGGGGGGNGNDNGSGGGGGSGSGSGDFSAAGRGYHPYANAMAAAYGSRTASAQSSPSTSSYQLQLDYVQQQSTGTGAAGSSAAASTSSVTTGSGAGSGSANPRMFGDIFRTESPVPFSGSPAAHYTSVAFGPGEQQLHHQQLHQHQQQQQHIQHQQQQPHGPLSSSSTSSSSMSVSPFDVSAGLFGLDGQRGMDEYYATVHPQHVSM